MVKTIDRLREGDVIYTDCIDVAFCYHLGIVHHDGDRILIYHNAPNNHNKYGGSVCAESYDDFIKGRNVLKITKTTARNQDIIEFHKNVSTKPGIRCFSIAKIMSLK